MAQQTVLELTLGPNLARLYITYEDTNQRVQAVRIENDYSGPIKITATNPGSGAVLTYTAPAGQYGTYTLANNERYFYDQWAYSMGAA